jgi:predicted aspartyl protease
VADSAEKRATKNRNDPLIMKLRNLLSLGAVVATLLSACAPTGNYQPRYHPTAAPSVVPLVRVQGAPQNPFVRATVNGRPGLFLVDTGATSTCLDARFAAELGLKPQATAAGTVKTNVTRGIKTAQVKKLELGGHVFENFAVAVLNLDHVDKALGRRMDGLLGMNVLRAAPFTIDQGGGSLLFGIARPGTPSVPLTLEQGGVFMAMQVRGLNVRMKVDTGTSDTVLTTADFARVVASGVAPTNVRMAGNVDVNGYTTNQVARVLLAESKAGNLTRQSFVLREGSDNLLGMDFFKGHVITFDGATGQVWIQASR